MNQKQRIIKYLDDFGSITPLEAIRDIGVLALSQRIGELNKEGAGIVADIVPVTNRYGQTSRVARYRFAAGRDLDATAAQAGATSELDYGGEILGIKQSDTIRRIEWLIMMLKATSFRMLPSEQTEEQK